MRTVLTPARELVQSAYLEDQRVLYEADTTVTLPGNDDSGNWRIEPVESGGWTVRNDADQGWVTDPNGKPRVFTTLDGALYYMIGDPR